MNIQLRGSAFESTGGNLTLLTINGGRRTITNGRGINTVVMEADGSIKASANHDVYGDANLWNVWADWLFSVAVHTDVVAVASYDAIRRAPNGGSAERLLIGIGTDRILEAPQQTGLAAARTPYALLFGMYDKECREVLMPFRGGNAEISAGRRTLSLTGSGYKSRTREPSLRVDGKSVRFAHGRGINTIIVRPGGAVGAKAIHDVHENHVANWNAWAEWVREKAQPEDYVCVLSHDSVRAAPTGGAAGDLLRSIGAREILREKRNRKVKFSRRPYVLLFRYGSDRCKEEASRRQKFNARLDAHFYGTGEAQTAITRPALRFNSNTFLAAPVNVSETAYTVSIWFRTDNPDAGLFSVDVGDRGSGGHDRHVYLTGGHLAARLWDNETIKTSAAGFNDGRWHRVSHVFGGEAGGQRLYVDGLLLAEGTKAASDLSAQDGINIGFSNDAARDYFTGEITEVSVWSIARPERDLRAWRELVTGREFGLQALYTFTDASGRTVKDQSSHGHHATLTGHPDWTSTDDFPGEFLPNIIPPELPVLAEKADTLRAVGKRLSAIVPEEPTPLPGRPLPDLIAAGELPAFNLIERLRQRIVNEKLSLNKSMLAEFGGIGSAAGDLMDVFVSVSNPKVELVKGKPGMIGPPGMETVVDATDESNLATPENHAVRLTGDSVLFSSIPAKLTADFFHYKQKPGASFRYAVTGRPVGVGTFLPDVPIISGLNISGPTFIVTNVGTLYDPTLDSGIEEGFNFFGNLKIATSPDPGLRFIGGILGVRELAVHAAVSAEQPRKIVLEAAAHRDITLVEGNNFRLRWTRSDVGLEVSGMPPEPEIGMSNDLVISLTKDGELTHLVFTGGMSVQPESITGAFTMNGTGRHPDGELTGSVQNTGEWKAPFGIPGVVIRQMAVQLGGTYAPPWIDNVGIHGNLKIGDVDGSASILVDANDPDEFVIAGATDKLTLLQVMSAMSPATFIAYQAIPQNIRDVMNEVVDVKMTDVKVNIVPVAASIGGVHFRDEGITVMGKLRAFGWRASMFVNVDTFDGITARGDMDPVNIKNFFRLTGADGDPAPTLRLRLGPTTDSELYLSAKVWLLGISREMKIEANEDGFSFLFKQVLGPVLTTELTCSYRDYDFAASGSFDFKLNLTVPTKWGDIPLVDVGLDAKTVIKAGKTHGFFLSLDGGFRFYGREARLPKFELSVAPATIEAFVSEVYKTIRDGALDVFGPAFKTLEEWANAVKKGVIKFTGVVADLAKNVYNASRKAAIEAYRILSKTSAQIISGLKNAYNATAGEVAKLLKTFGYAVNEISAGLTSAYALTRSALATALKSAGYMVSQVSSALRATFQMTKQQLANALKHAGFAVNEVIGSVRYAYNVASKEMSKILKKAGYAAKTAGTALKNAYNLSAAGLTTALKEAGYAVDEVAGAVKTAYGYTAKQVAKTLKAAGYAAGEVADGLKSAYRLSEKGMAAALRHAGFAIKDVGKVIKNVYNLSEDGVKKALKGAGYAASEIGNFFGNVIGGIGGILGIG